MFYVRRKGQDVLSYVFPSEQPQNNKLFCVCSGGKDRIGYPRPFLQIPLRIASYSEWKFGGKDRIRTCEWVAPLHAFQACAFNHSATFPLN